VKWTPCRFIGERALAVKPMSHRSPAATVATAAAEPVVPFMLFCAAVYVLVVQFAELPARLAPIVQG
jgi:hypothetical protein